MNCKNCGAGLSSKTCAFCGTVETAFIFEEPKQQPTHESTCGGKPIVFHDYNIKDMVHEGYLECNKCKRRTKTFKIQPHQLVDIFTANEIASLISTEALKDFNEGRFVENAS